MSLGTLALLAALTVLAPLLAAASPRGAVPVVVAELGLGIIVGPVLGLLEPTRGLEQLSGFGLGFLFFLAGMEADLGRLRGRPLRLGAAGWLLSLAIAIALAGGLRLAGLDLPVEYVAAALATTALGTLLPILRDTGALGGAFGRYAVASGVCGELLPILLVALLLTATADRALTAVLLVVFAGVAIACAAIALRVRSPRLIGLIGRSMHTSSQLPVRLCVLLLVVLCYLAEDFGLDVILGAFAAGMVVGLASGAAGGPPVLEHKLEAIGFGFLIPVFFIASGVAFDLDALTAGTTLLQVPLFLAALLAVRGIPALLYRRDLGRRDRLALALCSSTSLPLIVAITSIAVAGGHMASATAAALVAAGVLSVLLFPLAAGAARAGASAPGDRRPAGLEPAV